MKRTNPLALLGLTPLGFIVTFVADWVLVSRGMAAIRVPWSLAATVAVLTAIVIALGARVRWATADKPGRRIDPILAVQILVLAKASSAGGAVILGGTVGVLVFTLTRPVVPTDLIPGNVGAIVASILLIIGALVAERLCRIPPDKPEGEPA